MQLAWLIPYIVDVPSPLADQVGVHCVQLVTAKTVLQNLVVILEILCWCCSAEVVVQNLVVILGWCCSEVDEFSSGDAGTLLIG